MDKELLEAIEAMILASEERTAERTGKQISEQIKASEARMTKQIAIQIRESETRMIKRIDDSETRMKAYIESDVIKKIDILADGHKMLTEKLSRIDDIANDIEEMKGAMAATDAIIAEDERKIIELQRNKG